MCLNITFIWDLCHNSSVCRVSSFVPANYSWPYGCGHGVHARVGVVAGLCVYMYIHIYDFLFVCLLICEILCAWAGGCGSAGNEAPRC